MSYPLRGMGALADDGRERLAARVREILGSGDGADPRDEIPRLRKRIRELDARVGELMDSISPANRDFIDEKRQAIRHEREDLDRQIAELEAIATAEVDQDRLVEDVLAGMREFAKVVEEGSVEEKKIFARAFVHAMEVDPDALEAVLYLNLKELPLVSGETSGNSSFTVVAGTGYEVEETPVPGLVRLRVGLVGRKSHVVGAAG